MKIQVEGMVVGGSSLEGFVRIVVPDYDGHSDTVQFPVLRDIQEKHEPGQVRSEPVPSPGTRVVVSVEL